MHLFLLQHGDALAESVNPQRPLSETGSQRCRALDRVRRALRRAGAARLRERQAAGEADLLMVNRLAVDGRRPAKTRQCDTKSLVEVVPTLVEGTVRVTG